MFLMRSQFLFLLVVTGLLWVPSLSGAQDSPSQGQAIATTDPESLATIAEISPGQAVVIYQSAALTIATHGAPLIDVLREACSQLGTELDAPSDANEPVVGFFGPGPAREVLTLLLEGSQYELGTAGSVENAEALVRVVVFAKSKNSDRKDTKNRDALNATAEPVTQAQPDSTVGGGEKASAQKMLELLGDAKTNFVDNEADPEDPTAGVVKGQAGDIFKALEALIKTAAAAEGGGTGPSVTSPQTSNGGRSPLHSKR
jgi:hypothetical protein